MKRWQYMNLIITSEGMDYLNQLGSQGWEAYAVIHLASGSFCYFLKRNA